MHEKEKRESMLTERDKWKEFRNQRNKAISKYVESKTKLFIRQKFLTRVKISIVLKRHKKIVLQIIKMKRDKARIENSARRIVRQY
jgi:hypothetical protein